MAHLVYESLPRGGHTRVLHLEGLRAISELEPNWRPEQSAPGLDVQQPVPVCTLEAISLAAARTRKVSYVALSYCWKPGDRSTWNDSRKPRVLFCNGVVTYVGQNLFEALVHFSSLPTPPLLWADALCINQGDVQERNHQVSLMGDVYRFADHVAIWLGAEGHKVTELWRLFRWCTEPGRNISTMTLEKRAAVKGWNRKLWGRRSKYQLDSRRKRTSAKAKKEDLAEEEWKLPDRNLDLHFSCVNPPRYHLRRPTRTHKVAAEGSFYAPELSSGFDFHRDCAWFDRAWTFQEVVLARNAIVYCGLEQIPWVRLASQWDSAVSRIGPAYNVGRLSQNIMFIEKSRGQLRSSGNDLLSLLLAIWTRKASDVRDKVFAVLGMLHKAGLVAADYTLSTRQVIALASKACIEESGNLDILYYAGLQIQASGGNPTWGPKSGELARDGSMEGGWHIPSWTPDWGSARPLRFTRTVEDWPKLNFPTLSADFTCNTEWRGEQLIASGLVLGRYDGPDFPRCLRLASNPDDRPQLLKDVRPCHNVTKTDLARLCELLKRHDEKQCDCPEIDGTAETRNALPQSLYPSWTEPGDWLCILFGAPTPVLLRPDFRKLTNASKAREVLPMCKGEPRDWPYYSPSPESPSDVFVFVGADVKSGGKWTREPFVQLSKGDYSGFEGIDYMYYYYGDFVIR